LLLSRGASENERTGALFVMGGNLELHEKGHEAAFEKGQLGGAEKVANVVGAATSAMLSNSTSSHLLLSSGASKSERTGAAGAHVDDSPTHRVEEDWSFIQLVVRLPNGVRAVVRVHPQATVLDVVKLLRHHSVTWLKGGRRSLSMETHADQLDSGVTFVAYTTGLLGGADDEQKVHRELYIDRVLS
jgi:hypothetical protein